MNIKAILYVEATFKITGRGLVACCKTVWDSGANKVLKLGDTCMLIRKGEIGIVPFEIRGLEMAHPRRDVEGLLVPSDLVIPEDSHILVLEDEV